MASLALLMVLGALFGLILEIFGAWGRALMFALLITLTVDIQSTTEDRVRLLWIVFIASFSVAAFLRGALPRWGTAVVVVMFLISCFGPVSHNDIGLRDDLVASPGDPELPVVVHIVLDEHIGVEGIPEEFDQNAHYASLLRDLYVKHGFRMFGRAFSRYYNTYNTIPNMLNFDIPKGTRAYVEQQGNDWYVTENAYFKEMSARGYAIHVLQSKYLDYLSGSEDANIEWGWTFDPERLAAIQDTPLTTPRKMRFILGMYTRLSLVAKHLNMPVHQVTPVATLPVLELLREEVAQAQPGTLFFAHLLLPHGPYGLTETCDVRPNPDDWLLGFDEKLEPRRNNMGTRFMRYPLYLQQMECLIQKLDEFLLTFDESPTLQNATVILHGDHGSRLDCGPVEHKLVGELTPSDWVDGFSTLFAIKHPNVEPGYDRRLLPIDKLFEAAIRDAHIPSGSDWVEKPEVLLEQRNNLKPHPMRPFERTLDEKL